MMGRRAVAIGLAAILVLITAAAGTACAIPLDTGDTSTKLPDQIQDLKADDVLAYTAHAWLGAALDFGHCNPSASGLQWVKAAAHTRQQDRTTRVIQGLKAAHDRTHNPTALATELCSHLVPNSHVPLQTADLAAAGLPCNP